MGPRRMGRCSPMLLAIGLTSIALTTLAVAQSDTVNTSIIADNQEETYARCLHAAEADPEAGWDMSRRWRRLNGGEPAEHCAAASMRGLGDSEEAAYRLESLAKQSGSNRQIRSGLWGHAAQAWMDVEDYSRALNALNAATELDSLNADFFLDRALCQAALGDFWATIDDLNRVIDILPANTNALVLRGSAYRHLNIVELAEDDIERVLKADPENTDALLEKGLLALNSGDITSARKVWIRVLELAPDSTAGDAVRSHLESMDINIEPSPDDLGSVP